MAAGIHIHWEAGMQHDASRKLRQEPRGRRGRTWWWRQRRGKCSESGYGFEGEAHRTSRQTGRFLQGVRTQGSFLSLQRCQVALGRPFHREPCRLPGGGGLLGSPGQVQWPSLNKPRGEPWPASGPLFRSTVEPGAVGGGARGTLGEGEAGSCSVPHTHCGFSWQETHWGETL